MSRSARVVVVLVVCLCLMFAAMKGRSAFSEHQELKKAKRTTRTEKKWTPVDLGDKTSLHTSPPPTEPEDGLHTALNTSTPSATSTPPVSLDATDSPEATAAPAPTKSPDKEKTMSPAKEEAKEMAWTAVPEDTPAPAVCRHVDEAVGACKEGGEVTAGYDCAALEVHKEKMATQLKDGIEQSSKNFVDFPETDMVKTPWMIPELLPNPDNAHGFVPTEKHTPGCDPTRYPFTKLSDQNCMLYLQNVSNWVSIIPLSSVLSVARTIKFKVTMRDGTAAVLKVPQSKFIYEPYSECLAFHTDRVLGFNKVPPVAWVSIPANFLRSAAANMSALYVQWVEQFVFNNTRVERITRPRCPFHQKTIQVSVQLWMEGVTNYFNSPFSTSSTVRLLTGTKKYRNRVKLLSIDKYQNILDYSDNMVFDFIVDNTDRSKKNTFAVVRAKKGTSKVTGGILYLDQGSSFYHKGDSDDFALKLSKKHPPSQCIFRPSTIARLRRFDKSKSLYDEVAEHMLGWSKGIWDFARTRMLEKSHDRLNELLTVTLKYCRTHHPEAFDLTKKREDEILEGGKPTDAPPLHPVHNLPKAPSGILEANEGSIMEEKENTAQTTDAPKEKTEVPATEAGATMTPKSGTDVPMSTEKPANADGKTTDAPEKNTTAVPSEAKMDGQ